MGLGHDREMQAGWAADSPYHAVLAANIFCGLCADEVALMTEQGVFGQPVSVRINAGSSAVQGSRACSEPRRVGHGLRCEKKRELEGLNVKTHATTSKSVYVYYMTYGAPLDKFKDKKYIFRVRRRYTFISSKSVGAFNSKIYKD